MERGVLNHRLKKNFKAKKKSKFHTEAEANHFYKECKGMGSLGPEAPEFGASPVEHNKVYKYIYIYIYQASLNMSRR